MLTYVLSELYNGINLVNVEKIHNFSYLSIKGGKDQESIQSSTTLNQGYHMGK